ncbi:CD3324 family protein [Clostridium sp. 1001275B_160808_H3]|uniref:CD3324 family protein n=1 Tax=Clostridium sp. 1001275B_160808_H3 TaxID=2787110 RepID=UPI00189A2768|nr:CD3324 family protein [Clostridium sp. 1001275B_160808_H3]
MKYAKANDVLPDEIIKIIQKYVDGKYIYIPKVSATHKSWGEESGIKASLQIRNAEIYEKYLNGCSINKLCEEYFLSEKSIRRIIYQQKNCS